MSLITSADDVRSLKRVIPSCNPHPPDALAMLQRMFRFCQRDLVRDFLFTTSPTHLMVMTSPGFRANSIVYQMREAAITPTALADFRSSKGSAAGVIVPAFSAENTSLGFGIHETYFRDHCHQDDSMLGRGFWDRDIFTYRCAIDTQDGSYVLIAEEGHEVHAMWVSATTAHMRQRCEVRLPRVAVNKLCSQGSVPTYEQILKALTHNVVMNEYRDCQKCGSTHTNPCHCPQDNLSPEHPLDFSNFPRILSFHSGFYESIAQYSGYVNGSKYTEYARGLKLQLERIMAPELTMRLTQWAISDHMKVIAVNPMNSLLPNAAIAPENTSLERLEDNHVPYEDFENALFGEKLGAMEFQTENSAIQDETTSSTPTEPGIEEVAHCASDIRAAIEEHPYTSQTSELPELLQKSTNSFAERAVKLCHYRASIERSAADELLPLQHSQDLEAKPLELLQNVRLTQSKPHRHRRRRGVSPDDPEEIKRREEYKIMRREKNRASARRSNMKRKLENDTRRRELEGLKGREEVLREKEKELRLQNMQLRHAISQQT